MIFHAVIGDSLCFLVCHRPCSPECSCKRNVIALQPRLAMNQQYPDTVKPSYGISSHVLYEQAAKHLSARRRAVLSVGADLLWVSTPVQQTPHKSSSYVSGIHLYSNLVVNRGSFCLCYEPNSVWSLHWVPTNKSEFQLD